MDCAGSAMTHCPPERGVFRTMVLEDNCALDQAGHLYIRFRLKGSRPGPDSGCQAEPDPHF
eukprot:9561866-Prorocentrum_lima.AAC.1